MRRLLLVGVVLIVSSASGQEPASKLWTDLKAKREMLPGLHQEFEVSRTSSTHSLSRSFQERIVIDVADKKWRERSISGSCDCIRIFDGQDLLLMEADGNEYKRLNRKSKDDDPEPEPYGTPDLDWRKAKEIARRPCGFSTKDHSCIIIDVPEKAWARAGKGTLVTRLAAGVSRLAIDSETGALVRSDNEEVIERSLHDGPGQSPGAYKVNRTYSLTRMTYGAVLDIALFKLPEAGMREVKEFTKWDAARIRKELAGKPAPELEVTDIKGNSVSLASLKGKTVLLDFWTSWCPPCLADAPSLDKLYARYGGKNLMIIGISVSEERKIVETFLQKKPHAFPVVLTIENEMPRPYQVGLFPTYMVIAPDGTLSAAFEGDQGFGELRRHLERAGTPTE